jgi:hypothetical protein
MPAYNSDLFRRPAPFALVTLRNPSSGAVETDVPMLIDSGADATLLPQHSVELIGAVPDPESAYELESFDGSRSMAQAVHLDLLFLRRTFKGRFLLINQEWGILGRDVLNNVAIVLDGPRLAWEELRR